MRIRDELDPVDDGAQIDQLCTFPRPQRSSRARLGRLHCGHCEAAGAGDPGRRSPARIHDLAGWLCDKLAVAAPNGPRVVKGDVMSVYRVTEIIGTSSTSWEDAAAEAIRTAAGTLRDLRVAEVVKQDIHLDEGGAITYRTKLQLSFKYEPDH
jgi:dodecin